jgi:hypothetical protein
MAGRVTFTVAPDAVLPEGVGDGRRFATGDARRAGDAEALNLSHPLVTAAVGHARIIRTNDLDYFCFNFIPACASHSS